MAEGSAVSVILEMITLLISNTVGTLRDMVGLFRELFSSMGSVFGGGGIAPYVGLGIILVVAFLLLRFFFHSGKLIIMLAAIAFIIILMLLFF